MVDLIKADHRQASILRKKSSSLWGAVAKTAVSLFLDGDLERGGGSRIWKFDHAPFIPRHVPIEDVGVRYFPIIGTTRHRTG